MNNYFGMAFLAALGWCFGKSVYGAVQQIISAALSKIQNHLGACEDDQKDSDLMSTILDGKSSSKTNRCTRTIGFR